MQITNAQVTPVDCKSVEHINYYIQCNCGIVNQSHSYKKQCVCHIRYRHLDKYCVTHSMHV